MTLSSLQRNTSFIFTIFFLFTGLYLLITNLSGYDRLPLLFNLKNLILPIGIFAVAIPAGLELMSSETNKKGRTSIAGVALSFVTLVAATFFIFNSESQSVYLGLEQVTGPSTNAFLLLLGLALTTALYNLVSFTRHQAPLNYLRDWPIILYYAACGLGFAILILLCMELNAADLSFSPVMILLSNFLKRLVTAAALGQIAVYLLKGFEENYRKKHTLAVLVGSLLITCSLSPGADLQNRLNFGLELVSHLFTALGLTLLISSYGLVLFRQWKTNVTKFLATGEWIPHFMIVCVLFLILLTFTPASAVVFSGGLLESYVIVLCSVAIPQLLKISEKRLNKSRQTVSSYFSIALAWCGFVVITASVIILTPLGNLGLLEINSSARSFLSIFASGLFLVSGSILITIWDRFLHDII